MLGFDLHWWETAMLVSLGIAAIAAALVVVATTAVVNLQRMEVKDANERIAEASEGAEKAKAASAEANARAKEAELALEKYKQPRNLDIDSFLEMLKGAPPMKVQVLYVRECSDCSWVAQFIGSFLNAAQWNAGWAPIDEKAVAAGPWRKHPSAVSVRGYPWGITLVAKEISPDAHGHSGISNASVNALFLALNKSFKPGVSMAYDNDLPSDTIRVVVAPKS